MSHVSHGIITNNVQILLSKNIVTKFNWEKKLFMSWFSFIHPEIKKFIIST